MIENVSLKNLWLTQKASSEKLEAFIVKIRNKSRMYPLPHLFDITMVFPGGMDG